jgi:3-oxoacyl-[acyl-carrier protein] reductase
MTDTVNGAAQDQGLPGKRVLVTGGTKGIGRATTLAFAHSGASTVTCYHADREAADSLSRELSALGGKHQVVRADVTDPAQVAALVDEARNALGGLDVLVNNMGIDHAASFEDLTLPQWQRMIDYNITSVYLVTQAALAVMSDGGSIISIGSSAGLRGRPRGVHYTASKAALIGFTRALSKDVGGRGIRVNLVAPGLTETEPGAGLPPEVLQRIVGMTALGRVCQPQDVADAVLFLAGDTSRYISGATLNVDGGI